MNKVIIVIIVLVVAVVGILLIKNQSGIQNGTSTETQTSSSPVVAGSAIIIENMAYAPTTITVKVGDLVTWTNKDSVSHSATADDGSFDTGILAQGQSGTASFSKAGTYTYHCKVHPNMKATIIVE